MKLGIDCKRNVLAIHAVAVTCKQQVKFSVIGRELYELVEMIDIKMFLI